MLLLVSCSFNTEQKRAEISIIESDAPKDVKTKQLLGETISSDSIIWGGTIAGLVDDYILLFSNQTEYFFYVYKISGDRLIYDGSFLEKGNGPFEMLQPYSFYDEADNKLYIYDYVGKLRVMYSICLRDMKNLYNTDTWEIVKIPETAGCYLGYSLTKISSNKYLLLASKFGYKSLFSIMDVDKNSLSDLNIHFPNDGVTNVDPIVKQGVYMDGSVIKHPIDNKIVYACGTGKYAEIISLDNFEKRNLFKEYPKYYTRDGLNRAYKEECLRGIQLRANSSYIYTMTIPYTYGELKQKKKYKDYPNYYNDELFVFDWDGNLNFKYTLDVPVYSYFFDRNHTFLYGLTADMESGDVLVKRFALK